MSAANRLVLDGAIAARDALRYTPAGIAIVNFVVIHDSAQSEAGTERQVSLELACVGVEEIARVVAASPVGARVRVDGFLAPKGRSSRQPVLHVNELEFLQA